MKTPLLRPPKFTRWMIRNLSGSRINESVAGDLDEEFSEIAAASGKIKARFWYYRQWLLLFPACILYPVFWSAVMLRNYSKILFRNMKRHKGFTFINIAGLAAAFTCCIFIILFVRFELSFDKFHKDHDRLYRVSLNMKNLTGDHITAASSPLFAPKLRESYPQVEAAVRLLSRPAQSVAYQDKMFFERRIIYAEPELFDVFALHFIWGAPADALNRPNTAVLTQGVSRRYFNEKNPLGEKLTIDGTDYEVTGVIRDLPLNSHMRLGILLSMKNITDNERTMHYHNTNFYTYVKLATEVDHGEFSQQIRFLAHDYFDQELKERNTQFICLLQPVKDIHLFSHLQGEFSAPGNPQYLSIFSLVGGLILLIAGMNFTNLSTARSGQRSGEIGIRKVAGAHRCHLLFQFLGESVLLAFLALAAALGLVRLLLSPFNELVGSQFAFSNLLASEAILFLAVLALFTGLLAGSYPAFFLSGLKPSLILKTSSFAVIRRAVLRKLLVVGQFAISIALIIATLILYSQLVFMKNRPLGFSKEQKLIVRLPRGISIQDNYTAVKTEFLKNHHVSGAAFSSTVPGRGMFRFWIWPTGEQKTKARGMANLAVDYDFFSLYKLDLIAGRVFSREKGEDTPGHSFILNEAAVNEFGWSSAEEALTKSLRDGGHVIGVVKNFHYQGLQTAIEPLILWIYPAYYGYITLSVKTVEMGDTLALIKEDFSRCFPGNVMQYYFLDQEFANQYQAEERSGKLLGVFTLLGVFISGLGLLGLTAYVTERRSKEIGIRKVLGAPVYKIIRLLSQEFIKWVLLANILAWPLAYFAALRWLQGFAYRIDLFSYLYIFVFAAVVALIIAAATVFCQTFKAARADPVKTLRYE